MSQTKAQLLGPLVADNIDIEGDLNFDSGTLKVDPTNDRVGINKGANAPEKTLDVGGDVQLADLYLTADYPTIRPTLDLAFAQTKQLDSRITFTRSSTATYVDENGIIQTAAVNTPRFDHDPVTGESLGLLIEESRINLFTYSEDFNSGGWIVTASTVTSNTVTSPAGTTTADTIIPNTTNALHRTYFVVSLSNTTVYTTSYFIKPFENYKKVFLRIGGQSNSPVVVWNTQTKTVDDARGIFTSSFIEEYPNGWYKIGLTMTTNLTTFAPNLGVVSDSYTFESATNEVRFTGDGTSGAYIWGAQLEQGSFPTSYIPTSGSTVTRSSDNASFVGTNLTDWFNLDEGTWIVDTRKTQGIDGYYSALFYMRPVSGTIQTRNELYKRNGTGEFTYQHGINNGTKSANIDSTAVITAGDNTIFAYYKEDDFGLGFNGTIDTTDTSGTTHESPDPTIYLALGSSLGSEYWNGHISRFTYYPRRLNNSQLQNITL